MPRLIAACLVLPAALLAGCTSHHAVLNEGFGEAVQHNMVAQIINPDPLVAPEPAEANGQRAADAQERYRLGKVRPLMVNRTSSIPVASGGGQPGGGNGK